MATVGIKRLLTTCCTVLLGCINVTFYVWYLTEVVLQVTYIDFGAAPCSLFSVFHLLYLLFQFCCSREIFSVLRIWYTIMQVFFRTSYILLFSLVTDHWLELSVWRVSLVTVVYVRTNLHNKNIGFWSITNSLTNLIHVVPDTFPILIQLWGNILLNGPSSSSSSSCVASTTRGA